MKKKLTICVQRDLTNIKNALEDRGHTVHTDSQVHADTAIYIFSNIDEEWEGMGPQQQICFEDNKCVLAMNASKLSEEEILQAIDKVAERQPMEVEEIKKIKISLEEGLDEVKELLEAHGYEIIPSYKVDSDVAAMIFSGVDEDWETISTYQMRQYGDAKYVLTINASNMKSDEILETINRLCKKDQ